MEQSAEPRFLVIGQILKPHGVRGEVRVNPQTSQPERFDWLEIVYLGETNPQPVEVESVRFHKNLILLKLVGYDSRDAVESLRGQWLQVAEEDALPLEEGEYYLYQLLNLEVYTEDGARLGVLVDVIETGANNVFVVRGSGDDLLLPDTDEVIRDIDFENGRITAHLLPGL
ncbi:MAG: 16S rRNA processing protein RimM [Ardenticatenaceae bacterium]|nr:16S rRNA processing protein RimM [Anaerolineales bacterium]MCB8922557.1 16S rRNA processing protein RimM [Ardenticatenaceae bacterium]MCB8991225.1 16S rRNA processing protein RimM [Ardenticatenaceae bacterium]